MFIHNKSDLKSEDVKAFIKSMKEKLKKKNIVYINNKKYLIKNINNIFYIVENK